MERGEQGVNFARASIKFLRDQQPIRCVVLPDRKRVNAALQVPLREAAAQITLDPGGGLVALIGCLGEQFRDDG
jgi:hypothetical protein